VAVQQPAKVFVNSKPKTAFPKSPTPKTSFNCGLKTEIYKLMSVQQAEVQAKRPIDPYLSGLASNSEVVRKTVLNIHPSMQLGILVRAKLIIWLISFVAEPMNNIVIDTNPLVYIYYAVPITNDGEYFSSYFPELNIIIASQQRSS